MLGVAVIPGAGAISKAEKGVKGFRLGEHAAKQAATRGVSLKTVSGAIDRGVKIKYRENGVRKAGYYNQKSKIFVATRGKKIITVINKVKPRYVNNIAKRGR